MGNIIVRFEKDENGRPAVTLAVSLMMRGTFNNGTYDAMGRRQVGKKFIEGLCQELVKNVGPEIQDALKKEQHRYEHPEAYPDEKPEGEAATAESPGLNPALLGGPGGGSDQPAVQSEDQEPDNGD
jgi:hypothetical protein